MSTKLFFKSSLILAAIFYHSQAIAQEAVSTNQAIDQIERSLLSSDGKEISPGGANSGVRIGRVQNEQPKAPQVQMVIVDSKDNKNVNEKQKLAYAAMLVNQYEVALQLYKDVLKAEPKNNYARFGMAVCYHKLGQYRQAKNLYSELLKTNPANKEEIVGNLLEVIVEEAPNDAIYLLAKLSSQNPQSSFILARSAMAYDKINKVDQAVMLLSRAVAMDSDNVEYKFNLAVIYDKNQNYHEALNMYQQVVSNYIESDDINQTIPITEVKNRIDFIKNLDTQS